MLWYMAVRDSGQVDSKSCTNWSPFIQTYTSMNLLVWFRPSDRLSKELWGIHLCYCTYTAILVCTVAPANTSRYIVILLESVTDGRNQTSRFMPVYVCMKGDQLVQDLEDSWHPPDQNLVQPCTIAWYQIMEYSMYTYILVCTCTD